jgi:hypothetical protein
MPPPAILPNAVRSGLSRNMQVPSPASEKRRRTENALHILQSAQSSQAAASYSPGPSHLGPRQAAQQAALSRKRAVDQTRNDASPPAQFL